MNRKTRIFAKIHLKSAFSKIISKAQNHIQWLFRHHLAINLYISMAFQHKIVFWPTLGKQIGFQVLRRGSSVWTEPSWILFILDMQLGIGPIQPLEPSPCAGGTTSHFSAPLLVMGASPHCWPCKERKTIENWKTKISNFCFRVIILAHGIPRVNQCSKTQFLVL